MSLPTDPVYSLGTPENDEQREIDERFRELILDLMQEQYDADQLQYPYKLSYDYFSLFY